MSNVAMMVDRSIGRVRQVSYFLFLVQVRFYFFSILKFSTKPHPILRRHSLGSFSQNCFTTLGFSSILCLLIPFFDPLQRETGSFHRILVLIPILVPVIVSSPIIFFYDESCGVCMPNPGLIQAKQAYSYVLFMALFLCPSICRFENSSE